MSILVSNLKIEIVTVYIYYFEKMYEVIVFNKNLKQRIEEYNDVFFSEFLSLSEIRKEWKYFLEIAIDGTGWQALWKVPRIRCEELDIPFPSVVLVLVLDIDFKELTALVRVTAIQDDITIPEKNIVSLMQLWPTKEQDDSVASNIISTANALDMFRFFYLYLCMPWDRDEDDIVDWKSNHLESRLRFFYDMKNGSIPRQTAVHIHSLLTTARRLQNQREILEEQLKEQETETSDNYEIFLKSLVKINVKLLEIRSEIDLYENPVCRNVLIERQKNIEVAYKNNTQQIWIVSDGGTADDYIILMKQIKTLYPTENLIFSTSLTPRLEIADSKDIFLLNESKHLIDSTGALETGGSLRGIGNRENIIVTSFIEDVLFDIIEGDVFIENVTIDCTSPQSAFIVRKGRTELNNCKIIGEGSSSTHQGIIVLQGGELKIIDCDISGFHMAIVGNSGSKITVINSKIHNSAVGTKIFDNCHLHLHKIHYQDCLNYGILLETEVIVDRHCKVGGIELFEGNSNITIEETVSSGNGYGDFAIMNTPKLVPGEDMCTGPYSDPPITESNDDDMDSGKIDLKTNS